MSETAAISEAQASLYRRLAEEIEPQDPMTVTQWADAHRHLSSKASGEPGRYNSARTPHLRAIMDDLSPQSPVQRVTVKKIAQGGATEIGLNWIGYVMDQCPAPMLVVVPTLEVRKRWARQRLEPMIEATPVLAELFNSKSQRDGGNSEDIKDFPGGMLILGGANSPASLSSMPIRFFLCDEVERFPWEAGNEGDPMTLIDQRAKNFTRRKGLLISTPVGKNGRISLEYAASDQRQLFVPCPHCGEMILLLWQHEDGTLGLEASKMTGRVWYICRKCGAGIEEFNKTAMLAGHRWVARFPERTLHHGYHWNGLYSPLGLGHTWREMLDRWEAAQDDTTKLKAFKNTELGEEFEEKSQSVDELHLRSRVYLFSEALLVELAGLLRCAGVDIQKDRIEVSIYWFKDHGFDKDGKALDEEVWAKTHLILPGDTAEGAVWEDLAEALDEHEVHLAGIDAGYNTTMVNAFVEARPWCVALKGMAGMNRPLVEDERKRRARLRQRKKRGVPQEPVGVDSGKAMVYARLRKEVQGPGYIHYPDSPEFDQEFFAQLAAEKLETKTRKGHTFDEWVKKRPRNEALDCVLYAFAVYHLREFLGRRTPLAVAQTKPAPSAPRAGHSSAREEFSV